MSPQAAITELVNSLGLTADDLTACRTLYHNWRYLQGLYRTDNPRSHLNWEQAKDDTRLMSAYEFEDHEYNDAFDGEDEHEDTPSGNFEMKFCNMSSTRHRMRIMQTLQRRLCYYAIWCHIFCTTEDMDYECDGAPEGQTLEEQLEPVFESEAPFTAHQYIVFGERIRKELALHHGSTWVAKVDEGELRNVSVPLHVEVEMRTAVTAIQGKSDGTEVDKKLDFWILMTDLKEFRIVFGKNYTTKKENGLATLMWNLIFLARSTKAALKVLRGHHLLPHPTSAAANLGRAVLSPRQARRFRDVIGSF